MTNKKAQISQLQPMIIALVSIALVLVVGFLIFAQVDSQIPSVTGNDCNATNANDLACNATNTVVSAMEDIPGWLPIIVVTVIGALLIGLVAYFRGRG